MLCCLSRSFHDLVIPLLLATIQLRVIDAVGRDRLIHQVHLLRFLWQGGAIAYR